MSSAKEIAQQYIDGGVIPADMVGQDAVSKTYVNDQLALRDAAISGASAAAAGAQTDINTHKADNTVHVTPSEKTAYNSHISDQTIHVTPTDKANWNSKSPGSTQTDLTAHVGNADIHVTKEKKAEWDSKSPGSTQTDLQAHASNGVIHVTQQNKDNWNSKSPGSTQVDLTAHTGNTDIHTTAAEHAKLAGIANNAEENQNAFSYVNDVVAGAKKDTFFIVGGIGITVSTDPITKRVTITATGSATPGPHAISHISGGSDPIPNAIADGSSGLMSGADKSKLDGIEAEANKYIHPATHPASMIVEDSTHRFVKDVQASAWDAKETPTGAQAKVDALAGAGNTKTVKQIDDNVTAHLADGAAHGIGDKSTLLTAAKSSIVGAINEVFTNANSLKSDWAGVVGSPLVSTDTSAQLKSKTQVIKDTLATNLTNKGQSSIGTESLTTLVAKVPNINTGIKFATGTTTSSSSTQIFRDVLNNSVQYYYITVTGLDFTPSHIDVWAGTDISFYDVDLNFGSTNPKTSISCAGKGVRIASSAYVSSTGFLLPVDIQSSSFTWKAYGN